MITLYTAATPNGHKISIMLEELSIEYKVHKIDFSSSEQKEDWYTKLNPNGRIPTIVDHDNNDFVVFESGAILVYLAEKYNKFLPSNANKRSEVLQWLFFQMAGIGPMMGQANVFTHYAPEKIEFAIKRYVNESRRLFEVLDNQLEGRDFMVDDYSIADIATYPWVRTHEYSAIPIDGLSNLKSWMKRISERPAVKKGLDIPITQEELRKSFEERKKAAQKMIQK